MSEKFRDHIQYSLHRGIQNDAYKKIGEGGIGAIHDLIHSYYRLWNLRPEYQQQTREDFAEIRGRLNTEAGIIISNHPGVVDVPAIMGCLSRQDIKIMVRKGEGYDQLRNLIGEKYIVPADKNVLDEVRSHIQNGGVFIIFPSGGDGGEDIQFRNGFTELLSQLDSKKMIYSFYIDQNDVDEIGREYSARGIGAASAHYLGQGANINKLRETKVFRVNEQYSTAGEWQSIASGGTTMRAK